ncbi:hypothetical protein EDC02_4310 [Micromonospora sp. Llam0]|uniref:ATP-grasp domain-containing protein n=1 Tax=Micromonospora sp. Llam0 TaxID=2485143 RepID=UPI000F49AFE5|nr:ATP-grasp domain-containing protein [Micromonospora sp. Llam0]ROO62334.1 hypothetical protein EDC02_4310 [Micromonospora sp. Llam0]
MMLLVPGDPLRPTRPDEHFAPEARAAREAGYAVAVVDHDRLARGDDAVRAVASVPSGGMAIYRGWMLDAHRYALFVDALAVRGVTLRTTAEQYRRAHEFPGWYPTLATVTPRSAWTVGAGRVDFDQARLALGNGSAVIRDYVKSMKHHWSEAALIPSVEDSDAAWRVASRLRQLRDDDFAGGFVLREFEQFTAAEVRTWWVHGRCALVGPHPDTPGDQPPDGIDLDWLAPLIDALGLPFVTADLALRADGQWRVVEVGDGQVSDRPASVDPAVLIAAAVGEVGRTTVGE